MKRVGKPVAIVVALLCVAIFALSFFGVSSRYGDVITKTIYNVADLDRGLGFGFDATSVLSASEDVSAETLELAKSRIEDRLALMSVADYDVAIDSENNNLILRTAFSENSGYSPYQVANFLAEKGVFTVRIGAEKNEDGTMAGITAEDSSVILSNEDIKSISSSYTVQSSIAYYIISVELNRDAATDYANAVQKLIDDGVHSQLSYWIDDVMFYSEPLTEISNTTHLVISSNAWSGTQATAYALYLQSEPLPLDFEFKSSFVDQQASFGNNTALAMGIGAAVLLVVALVYLVVRFKMFGLSAFICMLGALGASAAVYTGVFALNYSINLTVSSFAALVATVIVSVERATRSGNAIIRAMDEGSSAGKAAQDVLSGRFLKNALGLAPLFFGGLFVFYSFGRGNFLANIASALSGGADVGSIAGLGIGIAMAAFFSLIFSVVGLELMTRSLCSFKAFSDKKWFGGKEND